MKKRKFVLLRLIWTIIKQRIKILYLTFIYTFPWPWPTAITLAAWTKYKESPLFRDRWIEFSRQMAARLYTYEEHRLFISLVKKDKQLMRKIIFKPYSILNDVTEDDYTLRKEIKF